MSAVPAARPSVAPRGPEPTRAYDLPRAARLALAATPWVLCAAAAILVGALYAWKLAANHVRMGFPLDDAYIYMTYAKQIARGRPFTYFDGGGYSAGATSMLWPLLESPLWAIGFRGHAFTYAVFGLCVALLGVTLALALAIGRRTLGLVGGVIAALLIATSGPTTFGYLAGMEVPLAGVLLLLAALLLMGDADERAGRPSRRLLWVLALGAIGRPEAGLLVAAVVGLRALGAAWRRRFALAGRWLLPLLLPLAIALCNRALAGHAAPNTAVSKSQLYQPGFSWAGWLDTLYTQGRDLLRVCFWRDTGPFRHGRILAALWLVGAARLIVWGIRKQRLTGVLMLVATPPAIFLAVLAASGDYAFHNYRYVSGAFPALFVVAGMALAPPSAALAARLRLPRPVLGAVGGIVLALAALGAWAQRGRLRMDVRLFAQSTSDVNAHTVRIGQWMATHLPRNARVALHDVGGPGYYGERRLLDIIGLITNHWAEICASGPGARFEALERIPVAQRPTHFIYYPGWLLVGARDLYGRVLLETSLPRIIDPGQPQPPRLIGGANMTVFEARWDVAGSGEGLLDPPAGWVITDAVDQADQVSERAHDYQGSLGPRKFRSPTATWTVFHSADVTTAAGTRRVADGGRTQRGARESFTLRVAPGRAARLVVRVGGWDGMAYSKLKKAPVTIVVRTHGGRELGRLVTPPLDGSFADLSLDLPADLAGRVRFDLSATGPYRSYHAFVIQPH